MGLFNRIKKVEGINRFKKVEDIILSEAPPVKKPEVIKKEQLENELERLKKEVNEKTESYDSIFLPCLLVCLADLSLRKRSDLAFDIDHANSVCDIADVHSQFGSRHRFPS